MRIRFYINESNPRAKSVAATLVPRAKALGLKVTRSKSVDVVLALGGDGTILRAVRMYPKVPILGFNLGGLGYLSSVEEKDFDSALGMLANGRYKIAERTTLKVTGAKAKGKAVAYALNDVVVMREKTGHALVLDVTCAGHAATRYMADGIIVATPTGSTAYSLAAGGPVLMPDSAAFVITPMSPHALGVRPIVVSDAVTLTITPRTRENRPIEKVGVYADGEPVLSATADESITISKAPESVKFIELEGYDPHEVLSRKLGWSGTCVK